MVPKTGKWKRIISQANVEPMFFCLYNTRKTQPSAAQVWAKMKISVQVMSFRKVMFDRWWRDGGSGCIFKSDWFEAVRFK